VLGVALGIVDLIVTKTKIFKPVRETIDQYSGFFGDLINCPICFGTWLSLAGTAVFLQPVFKTKWEIMDWGITWFFLNFITCLAAGILYRLYKTEEE
jgi:hypothetical protein